MFDGEFTAGPCPVLFSPDIEASTAALAADIPKSHYDLQRLSKAFFCHEDVMLKDALALVKKPRYILFIRYGLLVRTAGSHPAGPGSIPGNGIVQNVRCKIVQKGINLVILQQINLEKQIKKEIYHEMKRLHMV